MFKHRKETLQRLEEQARKDATRSLQEARVIIDGGWCQGYWAKDENGEAVESYSKEACDFCLSAAMMRAKASWDSSHRMRSLVEESIKLCYPRTFHRVNNIHNADLIVHFNDGRHRTKENVLRVLDRAIALNEEE